MRATRRTGAAGGIGAASRVAAGRGRRASILLTILALLVTLAACGSQPPTPTPVQPATANQTPTATEAATAASTTTTAPPAATSTGAPTAARTAAAAGPTPTRPRAAGPQSTAFPMKGPHIGYGMNAWLLPAADTDRSLQLLTGAGFDWARQWLAWESIEPSPGNYNWKDLDLLTEATQKHNVKLLVVIVRSPGWAAANGGIPREQRHKQAYATMLSKVAERYKGKVHAYEVWNEQNLAGETGGRVDPAEYVELLKLAFPAIKASDPGAFVLYGGLTPTGVNDPAIAVEDVVYLQQTYAYNNGEIKRYFDVLGAHPGGQNNPPDRLWPDNPGPGPGYFDHRSFYFRRIEDLRKVMEQNGDGEKQIWLTEFGWTTKNQAKGYEYGQYNSVDDQANYLVAAYQLAYNNYPWVGVMFMWNLNFSTVSKPDDEKTPWSVLYADYSPRPAYDALKRMPKR